MRFACGEVSQAQLEGRVWLPWGYLVSSLLELEPGDRNGESSGKVLGYGSPSPDGARSGTVSVTTGELGQRPFILPRFRGSVPCTPKALADTWPRKSTQIPAHSCTLGLGK